MSQDFGYIASSRDAMVELLTKKFCEKDTSIIWKALFQFARYSHVIALAYLYTVSKSDLDNMRALTFMMFFTFYSAFERLYRKTKWILSFYLCYLIFCEYYYSLVLPKMIRKNTISPLDLHLLKWYNKISQAEYIQITNEDDKWQKGGSIYFRHGADAFNWDVLLLMCALDIINKIFLDTKLAKEIETQSWKLLMASYPETLVLIVRIRNFLSTYLTLILCTLLIYCMSQGETTLINWIYFALNVLLLCFLSNNDGKKGTLRHSMRIANCIVYYSVFLLVGECLFTWAFGVRENTIEDSNDQWLKKDFPRLYEHLQLIGLRMYVAPQAQPTKEQHLDFFSAKCTSYIVYLLIGLYFSSKFSKELKASQDLEEVNEDDFRRIFEFHNDNLLEEAQVEKQDRKADKDPDRIKNLKNS